MYLISVCILLVLITRLDANKYVSTEEFIYGMGLKPVKYSVVTKDGFILTEFRIKAQSDCKSSRVAVLLHGHSSSPRSYVMNAGNFNHFSNNSDLCDERLKRRNIENSLVFALNKRCFEVWLITTRGTEHGLHHLKYKLSSRQFWDWSYDEIIKYDLPASMDMIKHVTKTDKVSFIGFSMGASLCLLLATNPKYENQLDSCILLGPMAPGKLLKSRSLFSHLIYPLTKYLGNIKIPFPPQPIYVRLLLRLCNLPIGNRLVNWIEYGSGYDFGLIETSRICDFIILNLSSSRAALHMLQIATTKDRKFHMYDFGVKQNLIKYGNTKPPEYDLSSISLKNIVIYYGLKDSLSGPLVIPNIIRLLKVQPLRVSSIKYDKFQHLDFLRSKDSGSLVNYEVLKALQIIHCGSQNQKYLADH